MWFPPHYTTHQGSYFTEKKETYLPSHWLQAEFRKTLLKSNKLVPQVIHLLQTQRAGDPVNVLLVEHTEPNTRALHGQRTD